MKRRARERTKDEDEGDRALVDMIYLFNRRLIDAGVIKPTQMIATLALEPCETRCGFGWTPAFALRPPDAYEPPKRTVGVSATRSRVF